MRLRELLEGIEVVSLTIPPDMEITQVLIHWNLVMV